MNYVLNFTLRSLKTKWSVMKSHSSTASSVREPCISMRAYGSQQTTNWFWNWFKKCMYPHQVNIRASIEQWSWSSVTTTDQACREQWTSTSGIAMSASGQSLQRIKRMNCSILFWSLNSVRLISQWCHGSGMWVLEVLLVLVLDKGSVTLDQVLWLKRRS